MLCKIGILALLALFCLAESAEIRQRRDSSADQQYDTIVVGLGAAGTAAYSKLARAGRRVLGLEAADRVGGRVKTIPFGDGIVEFGAEWIHGRNNSRSYELAVANHVPVKNQAVTLQVFWSDGAELNASLTHVVRELMYICTEDAPDDVPPQPAGDYFKAHCIEMIKSKKPELLQDEAFMEALFRSMDLNIGSLEGVSSWNEVGTTSDYEDLDEYLYTSWHKYGYKTLFEILLNEYNNGPGLPKTAEIKLNKEVVKIVWPSDADSNVVVKCKDGSEYTAKNVIVTVSLGVMKERHTTLFEPALPEEKVAAINNIEMGIIGKVILAFDKMWLPANTTVVPFFWRAEDLAKVPADEEWVTRIGSASRSMGADNVWVLWTAGNTTKHVETLSDETVKKHVVSLLRRFFGSDVPEPSQLIKTNWFTNPLTRGTYSFDGVSFAEHPDSRRTLGAPLADPSGAPRLLFAGEATNVNHFSTVHGAVETGIREANRLLGEDSHSIEPKH